MNKMLDKISKLLNQAENAGTPEEAAVFMEKVQELASINNVDLAVARMHQAKKEKAQEPEERRIQVNPYNRRTNRKYFAELGMAICDVNDVEYLIGGKEIALHCVGFPEDLDVVEALFAHLSIQMAMECDEALARGDHKSAKMIPVTRREEIPEEDRDWGGWDSVNGREYDDEPREKGERYWNYSTGRYRVAHQPPVYRDVPVVDGDGNPVFEEKQVSRVNGKVFRGNFYDAFIMRMRGRLWEIRKSVEREKGIQEESSETALAIRDKKEEVAKAHEDQRAQVQHMGVYKASWDDDRDYDSSGIAHEAGVRSAERVPVGDGREVK